MRYGKMYKKQKSKQHTDNRGLRCADDSNGMCTNKMCTTICLWYLSYYIISIVSLGKPFWQCIQRTTLNQDSYLLKRLLHSVIIHYYFPWTDCHFRHWINCIKSLKVPDHPPFLAFCIFCICFKSQQCSPYTFSKELMSDGRVISNLVVQ